MGIRIHPGTTPQARAELTAFIQAYAVTPAAHDIYWTPDPTDAAQYLDMEHNTAELISMDELMQLMAA